MPTQETTNKVLSATAQPRRDMRTFVADYLSRAKNHSSAFTFTGASTLVSLGSMLAAAITMRWISPEDLGLWKTVSMATGYAMLALVGVNNGLSRELPYFFGRSDEAMAKRLAGTALYYILAANALVFAGGLGCMLWFQAHGTKVLITIAAVTVMTAFTFYTNYLIVTFRSAKSFKDFAKIKFGEAALTVGTIPLLYFFHYNGMLGRALALSGVVLLLMHLCRPVRVTPTWNGSSFLMLMKTGAPIFVMDYITTSAMTCDRWVLIHYGGVESVGLFYLALSARDAIGTVSGALSEYIYPRMSYVYGQSHDPKHLWRIAVKSTLLVIAFMVPAAIAGWLLMPPVVTKFFPKYAEAVGAAQWMVIASIFFGATIGRMAIWSMKDWKMMTWYQVLYCFFIIGGPLLGGIFGKTALVGVAVGTLIAQAAWMPVSIYLIYLATHRRRGEEAVSAKS